MQRRLQEQQEDVKGVGVDCGMKGRRWAKLNNHFPMSVLATGSQAVAL